MEKVKTYKRSIIYFVLAIIMCSVLFITFLALYLINQTKLTAYGTSLENVFQSNFYSLTNSINNIEAKVSKVIVSNDKEMQSKVLDDIWRDCNVSENNISQMPLDFNEISGAISLINQLGGYSFSLSSKIVNGGKIDNNDREQLIRLNKELVVFNNNLNELSVQISSGDFKISENLKEGIYFEKMHEAFSTNANNTEETPELIYDGPYSNNLNDLEVKGLSDNIYSEEEARTYALKIFKEYNITEINLDSTTSGDFETYNYVLKTLKGDNIFAQIAKRDKFLLQFNLNSNGTNNIEEEKTDSDYIVIAEKFMQSLGFENMKAIFISRGDGLAYINVAPKINEIVYYPDIIKIKIDLLTSRVIGYEAKSYAFNHIERNIEMPKISIQTAQDNLSKSLEVISKRLALISKQYGGEVLAFEFECKYNNNIYYVFINAETGKEEEIFRVIENTEGRLVL